MTVVSVRDFRDRAGEMFRSEDVILVTRDGAPAGFYLPWDTPESVVTAAPWPRSSSIHPSDRS